MIDALLNKLIRKMLPPLRAETTSYRKIEGMNHFNFNELILVHNAVAEQIWREQQLVSNRMQWNFTYQGFLAAIYVFAGSNLDGWQVTLVQMTLAAVGVAVAWSCLKGVVAAQAQSNRLKRHWANEFCVPPPEDAGECNILRGAFPQPFSTTEGSRLGRHASRNVCGILMAMWVAMSLIALLGPFLPKSNLSGRLACTISGPAQTPHELSIICRSK